MAGWVQLWHSVFLGLSDCGIWSLPIPAVWTIHTQHRVDFPGTFGYEIVWKFCLWCPTNLKQLTMTFRKLSQQSKLSGSQCPCMDKYIRINCSACILPKTLTQHPVNGLCDTLQSSTGKSNSDKDMLNRLLVERQRVHRQIQTQAHTYMLLQMLMKNRYIKFQGGFFESHQGRIYKVFFILLNSASI